MHAPRPLFIVLSAALLGGCGDNLSVPDRDPYGAPAVEPLACVPNLDGRIDATELQAAIGVPVRYLVSPAGEERSVDVVGFADEDGGLRWDFGVDLASDQLAVVTPAALDAQWYAGSFPPGAFVTPFDAAGRVHTISVQDGEALWLHGLASAEENPPEGQTLLVYDPPIAVFRFPIQPGSTYSSTGSVTNAMLRGLPYAGSDTYDVTVDATGTIDLPQLTFTQAMRVRTEVTVTPAVGAATSQRQVSFMFECFGEVVRAVSLPDEPNPDFTTASEMWRLGLR